MSLRCCARFEDFQSVASSVADWPPITEHVQIGRRTEHFATENAPADAVCESEIIVTMRERVPFSVSLFARQPRLTLRVASVTHKLGDRHCCRRGTRNGTVWHRQLIEPAGRADLGAYRSFDHRTFIVWSDPGRPGAIQALFASTSIGDHTVSTQHRMMRLGAFLPAPGHHIAAWRHPDARPDGGLDFDYYRSIVQTAERGKFDLVFLSDGAGVRTHYKNADELSRQGRMVHFEPLTLLSALAVHTTHIGLTATASTTYNEPFHIARKFASLDYLSGGRSGWNVVTSVTDAEARNFNLDQQPDHAARYHRAREFMAVVTGLWDSWEDDAFLYDKESGRFFDPTKLHILGHQGEHFSVRGPLNVARPPQGYPVIVQAGSSGDGQDFAAQWAEVVFTAQQTLEQAQAYYRGMRAQIAAHGRNPDDVKIMPGAFIVIGRTQAEAEDKYSVLQALVDPVVGLGLLTGQLGDVDISGYPLDGPLPELPPTEGSTSKQQLIYQQAHRQGLTIRELYLAVSAGRGHRFLLGTPETIADQLEDWFVHEGADGFNIMPDYLPTGLEDIVDLLIPELQRRGLMRTEYRGRTLRDHLGLPRPSHRTARGHAVGTEAPAIHPADDVPVPSA